MGKRRHAEEDKLRKKKIRKLERKLQRKREESEIEEGTPRGSPTRDRSPQSGAEIELLHPEESIPEDLLGALGPEGQDIIEKGEPLQEQLCTRWDKIMTEGLNKESREALAKKYPTPANFPTVVAPEINPEIAASLTEIAIKRDKRITGRQNQLGLLMSALGKTLTQILRGELNNKKLVEEINDSAKVAADIFHQDSVSRKFFTLISNTTPAVREALKGLKPDKWLFGANCGEKIRDTQTIQKTSNQIKLVRRKEENWRRPLPNEQQVRSGQYQTTQEPHAHNLPPQRRQPQPYRNKNQQPQKPCHYNQPAQGRGQKREPQTRHYRR